MGKGSGRCAYVRNRGNYPNDFNSFVVEIEATAFTHSAVAESGRKRNDLGFEELQAASQILMSGLGTKVVLQFGDFWASRKLV